MRSKVTTVSILCTAAALIGGIARIDRGADWPIWGGTSSRNMVAVEKGLPATAKPGEPEGDDGKVDLAKTENVKWIAKLGSQTYGNPTVADGKVFVGTNNDSPRDPTLKDDAGILMCLDEGTGKLLWQLFVPKLAAGKNADWEKTGLCSSPCVDGNRVYVVTNRCEIVCLDVNGMGNGNDGPFKDEAEYFAGPGGKAIEPGPQSADIIWRYDMRDELGVFPHNMTSSSVLIVGDRLYATTSNSVDWTRKHTPNPSAPALICLDKRTGKLLGREESGISSRLYNSNWSSPSLLELPDGSKLIIFGAGDGFCYAFGPEPPKTSEGETVLKEVWRCDCNPPARRLGKEGKPARYTDNNGPSEILATPVCLDGKVYVAIGQSPDNPDGLGGLTCIDGSKTGDISKTGIVWQDDQFPRSLSTAAIADGLIYLGDFAGVLHCIDQKTGKPFWTNDLQDRIWGSALVADGKVYVSTAAGLLFVMEAGREKKVLGQIDFGASPLLSTPVAANGILYITSDKNLYALKAN